MDKELELMLELEDFTREYKLILKLLIVFRIFKYKINNNILYNFKIFKYNKILSFFLFNIKYFNKFEELNKSRHLRAKNYLNFFSYSEDIFSNKIINKDYVNWNRFFKLKNLNYFIKNKAITRRRFLLRKYTFKIIKRKKNSSIIRKDKRSFYRNKFKFVKFFNYKIFSHYKLCYNKLLNLIFNKFNKTAFMFLDSRIKKEIFINFLKRKNFLNLFYKNFYYIAFIKKKKTNIYITITNRHGDVIVSQSFGKIGLYAKKQRKIQNPLKALFVPVLQRLNDMGIFIIECVYLTYFTKRVISDLRKILVKNIYIKKYKNYFPVPHNNKLNIKHKKIRRI